MYFLHGFLWWLSGHCWGCRLGAKWRQRSAPALANPLFVSTPFLWFALSLSAIDGLVIFLSYTAPEQSTFAAIGLFSMIVGLATGLAQGREEYSPL